MSVGIITTEFTIWCSVCEDWHQTADHSTKREFERDMRRNGWRRRNGWIVCKKCNEKYDAATIKMRQEARL